MFDNHFFADALRRSQALVLHHKLVQIFLLSWLFAVCSQIVIPLPYNLVPLSLQPLPLLLCAHYFGWTAVHAYLLYVAQGAMGAPFFSHLRGGLMHLCGPTGGYLWGFLLAMILVAASRTWATTRAKNSLVLLAAGVCYFACGIAQLACFLPYSVALTKGLLPFVPGDLFKLICCMFASTTHKKRG